MPSCNGCHSIVYDKILQSLHITSEFYFNAKSLSLSLSLSLSPLLSLSLYVYVCAYSFIYIYILYSFNIIHEELQGLHVIYCSYILWTIHLIDTRF